VSSFYIHDPNALLDYDVDWAPWLATGDSIASTTFTVVDVGIVLGTGGQAPSFTVDHAKVWVTPSGTAGKEYRVMNSITTAQGRVEDQTITFLVEDK
jgi:hypothetical protein